MQTVTNQTEKSKAILGALTRCISDEAELAYRAERRATGRSECDAHYWRGYRAGLLAAGSIVTESAVRADMSG